MSGMPRRIGVFGGSFDPPHLAHLAPARAARDSLVLDEVRWLPAGQPWQKAGRRLASAADREAMLRLLIEAEPGFVLDPRELRRTGPSYTLDTVRELTTEQPGAALFVILGADPFARLHTWHAAEALAERVTFAVAAREGQAVRPPEAWPAPPLNWVELPLPRLDISATEARRRAAAGEAISPLVGDAVARYIDQQHLYRAAPGH
jgi:nicotinate-nucleotide adenylyltransferase